jgi:hypothetical protein
MGRRYKPIFFQEGVQQQPKKHLVQKFLLHQNVDE